MLGQEEDQGEKNFNGDLLSLCGRFSSCITSGWLHFLLGEISVCKEGDIFSQEPEKKFVSKHD